MVAPGSKKSNNSKDGCVGKAKKMGFRNMVCSVVDPEMEVIGSPKKNPEEEKRRRKQKKAAQAKKKAELLAIARAAVLEQAEKLPSRTYSSEPNHGVMSLEAPVLSSIVESVTNSRKKMAGADAAASDGSATKSSRSSNSILSKNASSKRIVVREDTESRPKDEAEQTIVKLLLSDVWSGNESVVECSLKLINICLERDPRAAEGMVSVGGHTVMLGIMKKWSSNPKIQAHACHFIGKCSCKGNKAFADAALKYGALPRIQKALVKYPKYLMVQTAACQALEQLLLICTDHRAVMDGIHIALVTAAMKTLTVTAPLQKAGAGILQGLAEDPVLAQTIVAEGGMEVMGGAFHRFCDSSDADHVAIRQRCRATIPKLLKEAARKRSMMACSAATPTNVGCRFFF